MRRSRENRDGDFSLRERGKLARGLLTLPPAHPSGMLREGPAAGTMSPEGDDIARGYPLRGPSALARNDMEGRR